jgi:hypothetical protein
MIGVTAGFDSPALLKRRPGPTMTEILEASTWRDTLRSILSQSGPKRNPSGVIVSLVGLCSDGEVEALLKWLITQI